MTRPRRSSSRGVHYLALLAGLLLGGCMGSDQARAQGPDDPDALLREGRYAEAIERLEARHAGAPSAESATALADVLAETGRYARAEEILATELAGSPDHGELQLRLGRIHLERGRLAEAEAAFRVAAAGSGGAALLGEMHLGEILLGRGEREAALEVFDRFIDVYNQSTRLESRELQAVAAGVAHLGATNPALFRDALMAYDEAIAEDPGNLEAHIAIGMLFLDSYNLPDARGAFREVLARRAGHPRALLGLALAADMEGSPEAGQFAEQALENNPALVPALVLRARSHLSGEDLERAEEDIEAALAVNPGSGPALAVIAASRLLQGDQAEFARIRDRALAVNPRDANFFVDVAELASRGRFYAEAADLARQGAALDSLAWNAFGVRGLNQLRTGEMEEGRRNLEIAFQGDPFNIWIKNTLDLLDVMDEFEVFETELTQILVDPEDGEALAIYMIEVAEASYHALADRYRYRLAPPVRIEAFRRSADFSVRTMGLTGLGALGVSFGSVLAMDSPAARGARGFHWASTLWHEMAHAFHLAMTDHRVPRWFSEGLAVHEERLAGTGWGMAPSLSFFAAYGEGSLRTPSELSQSFVRPRFPEEVGYAYVLGSLVMEWIEERWGSDAILAMLDGYRDMLPQEEVIQRRLGLDPEGFDREFDTWFRERYSGALRAADAMVELRATPGETRSADRTWLEERVSRSPADVASRVALGALLVEAEAFEDARRHLEEARDIFPQNPDPRGPNRLLAELHRRSGDNEAEIAALRAHLANASGDYEAHLALASLLEQRDDIAGAVQALEEAVFVYPFEIPVHERLARAYRELGEGYGEVRERRVILALGPVDRAGALHDLADAQFRAGDMEGARVNVLRALELAPRFPEAQDLLLRIVGGGQ